MTLHILSEQNTVLNKFIAQIRDKRIQKDSMRFRRNMERIGEITAYEISKALNYKPCVVETPTSWSWRRSSARGFPTIRGF